MFGIVDRLLLRQPAHVVAPERIARIYFRERGPAWMGGETLTDATTTYTTVTALRERVPSFAEVAGVFRTRTSVGRGAEAGEIDVAWVSGNYFPLLGARPAAGRFFLPEEDRPPVGARVAVLSHGYARRFGGADAVIGSEIVLGKTAFTVVGVAPERFTGLDLENVDVWIPVAALAAASGRAHWDTQPDSWWIRPIARLRDGATAERAAAEATLVYRREVRTWSDDWRDTLATVVTGPAIAARGPAGMPAEGKVSLWLVGVSAIVLLVACANTANLLLARAVQRRREIGVRLALGVAFHHGPVLQKDADVFGDTVNLAARLVELAAKDQIITTLETARQLGAAYRPWVRTLYETDVKGRSEKVELCELVWRADPDATATTLQMPIKRLLVEEAGPLTLVYRGRKFIRRRAHDSITLGRDEKCGMVVEHEQASRQHCTIEKKHGKFVLVDHSTNGTYVTVEGSAEVLVQREEFALTKRGFIALGQPKSVTKELVEFICE